MSQSEGVSKLKELLFENESRTLTELQHRIETVAQFGSDQRAALSRDIERLETAEQSFRGEVAGRLEAVFSRAGTEERFRTSVAEVLDRALTEAEVSRHEELSRAVAPLVVRTIRREIHNSQDELVEALYPITGRLVQAYVANAIRDLTDGINRQLSSNSAMLRFKSILTGRSMAELALAESQRFGVEELFLVRRGSGELLARWPDTGASKDRDQVMSGILTAINEFALEAFADDGSALRQIDLNTSQVYLRASPTLLLAAKCTGVSTAAIERVIDEEFMESLRRHRPQWEELATASPPSATRGGLLSDVAERLDTHVARAGRSLSNDNSGWIALKAFGWTVVLLLAAWIGWSAYKYATTERVRERANKVIAETESMKGYPVRLAVADYGTGISLAGLAPSDEAKAQIVANLRRELLGIPVDEKLAVLPTAPDATPLVADLRAKLTVLQHRLDRQPIELATSHTVRRLSALEPDLRQLQQMIREPQSRVETVNAALHSVVTVRAELEALQEKAIPSNRSEESALGGDGMASRLPVLRARITNTANALAGLLDANAAKFVKDTGSARTAKSALLPEAEAMALETERLANVVVAVAQAAIVEPPPLPLPTPREQLAKWIGDHAIFFSTGTSFRDPATASRRLGELAGLVKATTDVTLRVVGFTDEKGGTRQNSPLSQDRADLVKNELIARGVPNERLIAVGRLDAKDISTALGDSSPNRRVEFELTFVGETSE
jgi:outer membrane protein OmpA-like peptidoglycan-associated protein